MKKTVKEVKLPRRLEISVGDILNISDYHLFCNTSHCSHYLATHLGTNQERIYNEYKTNNKNRMLLFDCNIYIGNPDREHS